MKRKRTRFTVGACLLSLVLGVPSLAATASYFPLNVTGAGTLYDYEGIPFELYGVEHLATRHKGTTEHLPEASMDLSSYGTAKVLHFLQYCAWSGEHSWQRIFDFGSGTEVNMFLTLMSGYGTASGEPYELRFAITTGGGGAEERISATPLPGGWHHVAVTINADAHVGTLYVDGAPVAAKTGLTLTPSNLGITSQNWLGRSQYSSDSYFQGALDDFRIYDQALSQGEIQAVMAEAN